MLDIDLQVMENAIVADARFDIRLEDYDIDIPRIVYKKISDIINVKVHVELK